LSCIQVVSYSSQCALASASIRANLKTKGIPIGPYDILIAGTCMAHGMIMVTSNIGEFERISELKIEDWRK